MVQPQEKRACLLLHGFTGGPYEVEPLTGALSAAGWSCCTPELPGHGSSTLDLGRVSSQDWLDAAEEEARKLERQYGSFDLVGFSMGGLLAVHVAARFPVRRLALLSAAAIYVSPSRFIREWWRRKQAQDPSIRNRIRQTPLHAVWEFMRTVRTVTPELSKVSAPTIILHGMQDHIVHPNSAAFISARLGGTCRIQYLPTSRHLVCLEDDKELVIRSVLQFFRERPPQ